MKEKKIFLIFILLLFISISSQVIIDKTYADNIAEINEGSSALYLKTQKGSDYAEIEDNIEQLSVSPNNVYEIEFIIKVLSFSSAKPGNIFQLDIYDSDDIIRFSFRLKRDESISFHYPHSSSSIAVNYKESWQITRWYKLGIKIAENRSSFYLNGELLGENQPELPALIDGYELSRIRFGEVNDQYATFEGFIDDINIYYNETIAFHEGFDYDLKEYNLSSSENSVIKIEDPEAHTRLMLEVDSRSIEAGEDIGLFCTLKDSNDKGLPNKSIHLQISDKEKFKEIEIGATSTNGTIDYNWRVPNKLEGSIDIWVEFFGDDLYSASKSNSLSLFIIKELGFVLDTNAISLLIAFAAITAFIYSSHRFGFKESSKYLFFISTSMGSFYSIINLAKSYEIEYYLIYNAKIIDIELISQNIDSLACVILFCISFVTFIVSGNLKNRFSKVILICYFILAVSLVLYVFELKLLHALIIFLLSIFLIGFSIIHATDIFSIPRVRSIYSLFIAPLTLILFIELSSIIGWILNAFDPHVPFDGSFRWYFAEIELNLTNLLYPLTPYLLVILLFSWIWIPLINKIQLKSFKKYLTFGQVTTNQDSNQKNRFMIWLTIILSITCVLFSSYYPYFYNKRLIGVDTPWYFERLSEMTNWKEAFEILTSYEVVSRWSYLFILYIFKNLTGLSSEAIVKIGPALPASFLAISTYLLIKILTKDRVLSILSLFLTAFSINTTVGIFAGIYSNWLAISWIMLLLATIVYAVYKGLTFSITSGIILNFLILLTHAWSWFFMIVVLITFVLLTFIHRFLSSQEMKFENDLKTALILILCNAPLAIGFIVLMPSSQFIQLSSSIIETVSRGQMMWIISNLNYIITQYVGGFFGNPILFLVAILGMISLIDFKKTFNRLIISIIIPISLFGTIIDPFWEWRLIYMVPFQILATFGFRFIMNVSKEILSDKAASKKIDNTMLKLLISILLLIIILSQFNYALRCINFVSPV
ncbi:LamG-like jellyroll fold domain-containing protein [[Eubacterium] cellulosolvens]